MRHQPKTQRQRGQIVIIFSLAIFLFMGLCAIALDISWYWLNGLKMQRAADAAALAGVVHLPGDVTTAISVARDEAKKNGFENGVGGVVVTPVQDSSNARRLRVNISGPIGTYFARVFGFNSFPATKDSKAEYVLPVPMGSPDPYYGVFGELRHPGGGVTTYTTTPGDTGWLPASATKGTNTWTNPGNVYTSNNARATSATNNQQQAWGNFAISPPAGATITGIEVALEANRSNPGGTQNGCRMSVDLSWDNGSNHTSGSGGDQVTPALTTSDPGSPYYVLGSSSDLWNRSSWSLTELNNTNFRVRVTNQRPGSTGSCSATAQLDLLRVRVSYTTTTSVFTPDSDIQGPAGQILNPQGFWGVMHGSGSDDINGDKYQPRYAAGSGNLNPDYDSDNYYNYAVEIPAGASGSVYVYDPVFCAVASDMGTGDRWFGGSTEIWSFYDLYDTQNTLYDQSDDGSPVATTGTLFKTADPLVDPGMGGPSASSGRIDCTTSAGSTGGNAGGAYHNAWYQLPGTVSGGAGGKVYRLHTTTTDASNPNGNLGANGQNSFALYVSAPGARIYGLGAMEQYSPLPASQSSTFYLAQLEAVHAGKTMEIKLWDIGDTPTSALDVSLEILQPTTTGWTPATMSWTATKATVNGANCNSTSGTGSLITAKSSGTQYFQGCWLTIQIPLPQTYSAPQQGWWKIRYNVGTGSGSGYDLTTWQVQVRGNPVHLVLP